MKVERFKELMRGYTQTYPASLSLMSFCIERCMNEEIYQTLLDESKGAPYPPGWPY